MTHAPLARNSYLAGLLTLLAGCLDSCRSDEQLAELTSSRGEQVERDTARSLGVWRTASSGDRFYMGDGLRTGADCTADLALSPSGLARVEQRTVLRFLPNAPQLAGPQVAVEKGVVEIIAQQMDLEIHTPRAVARVTRGSRLKLSAAEGRERFDLVVGRVTVAHEGETEQLQPAQPLELGPLATSDAAALASAERTDVDTAPNDASTPEPLLAREASQQAILPPGTVAEIAVGLEPATIHAAQLPVTVHLKEPACSDRLRVQRIANGQAPSDAGFLLRLGQGKHLLRVLCGQARVADVPLLVKKDAGRVELPKRAQNVRIEADGRRYTVLYQNLLPTVSFAWPNPPASREFTLLVRRGQREQSFRLTRPEHAVSGAALGEGEYKFWFRDAGGRSSKPGTLRLSFDDAARSAYLASPLDGSGVAAQILVEGAALQRSRVSVEGQSLAVDERGRFRAEVPLAAGRRSVAVRVDHPEGGVHYYLRRLR